MNDHQPAADHSAPGGAPPDSPHSPAVALPVPPDWMPPSLPAPSAIPPNNGQRERVEDQSVKIGRRFPAWLLSLVLVFILKIGLRAIPPAPGLAPRERTAARPTPSATVRPRPTTASRPARVPPAVVRRNGRVVFSGSGFSAQIIDSVLYLTVLRPGGYGRVDLDYPPTAGAFVYTLQASRLLGDGELLATLTSPEARITWNVAFNTTARTWFLNEEHGATESVTIRSPRSYQELISDGQLRTITIARKKGVISLAINGTVVDDAILEDLATPLRIGVGARMPRDRSPPDAARFQVLIPQATLETSNDGDTRT